MGGSEDGEANGVNGYGVMGTTDGPGSVSTPLIPALLVEGESGLLLLPEEKLSWRLEVDALVSRSEREKKIVVEGWTASRIKK
jgi:hypothetical protein